MLRAEVSIVMVKSVTLQCDDESDSANSTSHYGHGKVCVSTVRRCQNLSISELNGDLVKSAVLDGKVSYSKFSV